MKTTEHEKEGLTFCQSFFVVVSLELNTLNLLITIRLQLIFNLKMSFNFILKIKIEKENKKFFRKKLRKNQIKNGLKKSSP